ncbi:MAG UNVERIFIED_CONTAM: hypothetical protein LVR18_24770 [Planctomycetaceae bacterium]
MTQYKALKTNPVAGGFLAAFLNPDADHRRCSVHAAYAGKHFEGNAEVRLSTDGKVLLAGDLPTMNGLQRRLPHLRKSVRHCPRQRNAAADGSGYSRGTSPDSAGYPQSARCTSPLHSDPHVT